MTKHLYTAYTEEATRYFLLPEAVAFLPGDFPIHDHTGEPVTVDAAWVKTYEVDLKRAEQAIQGQLQAGLDLTRQALLNQATLLAPAPVELDTAVEKTASLVQDVLGFSADDVRQEPEIVKRRLDDLFRGIANFVADSTAADPAQVENARRQMQNLGATFRQHGLETGEKWERLPHKLRAAYFTGQTERNQRLAAALQQLASQLRQTAVAVGAELEAKAAEYRSQDEVDDG